MSNADRRFDAWQREVPYTLSRFKVRAIAVLMTAMLGFAAWAMLAPLDGAVVAAGSFVAAGQNKQIQHLEGGIIRDLLVREGDLVDGGQVLVRLDETAAQAKLRRLTVRKSRLLITQARLVAQIEDNETFEPPATLASADDLEIKQIIARQLMELRVRRQRQGDEEEILRRNIAGLRESITGYQSQVQSLEQRIGLFGDELRDKQALLERQLLRRTEVMAVQRAEAGLTGQRGELMGRIADAKERIASAEQQISQVRSATTQKAVEELRETETELDDIEEQIHAARDVLDRVEVRAPERGIIVKVNYHARGAVVAPGAPILEIVPAGDQLMLEARVRPSDITHVKPSQEALVRLTALNQRLTPVVAGKVIYVSADAVAEPTSTPHAPGVAGPQSFIVRVTLEEEDVRRKIDGFRPTPGMPADVYIKTGERTFFEYIMRPVADSFSHAFREH
jgi:membrane fusion protein, type I secretion system